MRLEGSYSPIIDNPPKPKKSHLTYLLVSGIAYKASPVSEQMKEIAVRESSLAYPSCRFQVFQVAPPMMEQG